MIPRETGYILLERLKGSCFKAIKCANRNALFKKTAESNVRLALPVCESLSVAEVLLILAIPSPYRTQTHSVSGRLCVFSSLVCQSWSPSSFLSVSPYISQYVWGFCQCNYVIFCSMFFYGHCVWRFLESI